MERPEGRRLAFVVSQVPKCEGPGAPDFCGLPPIARWTGHRPFRDGTHDFGVDLTPPIRFLRCGSAKLVED